MISAGMEASSFMCAGGIVSEPLEGRVLHPNPRADVEGEPVEVKVVIGLGGWDGECKVTVNEAEISMKQTR